MQLRLTAKSDELRLLWWVIIDSPFLHGTSAQMIATLMGVRILAVTEHGNTTFRPCFFAGHSAFFKNLDIDAAVVEETDARMLIPNPFSPRKDLFQKSAIHSAMQADLLDYSACDRDGWGYIMDGDVNRKDEQALLTSLRGKYPLIVFHNFAVYAAGDSVTAIDSRS